MAHIFAMMIILVASTIHAEEYVIDDYELEWTVVQTGDVSLRVVKNEEITYIQLYDSNSWTSSYLRLSASEAIAISDALSKTEEYFNSQKGSAEDRADSVAAGDYKVEFSTSVKYGFKVRISTDDGYYNDSFTLGKIEAMKLQPKLAEARELIAFIDQRIDL